MLSLLFAAPSPGAAGASSALRKDPPIRLWLSSDGRYQPGDRGRVHVRTEEDGYVVVLQADEEGLVRVLFPADPTDDDFLRGGKKYEIRGRGDREAFAVSRRGGSGTMFAARSRRAFHYESFVRGDHWDYRALDARRGDGDAEAALLDIVRDMAGDADFDYDVATYTVSDSRGAYYPWHLTLGYYSRPCFGCYGGVGWGVGFWDPFFADPFLSPACWTSLFCYPGAVYAPWGYSYVYRPFYGYRLRSPWWGPGYRWRGGVALAFGFGYRAPAIRPAYIGERSPVMLARPRAAIVSPATRRTVILAQPVRPAVVDRRPVLDDRRVLAAPRDRRPVAAPAPERRLRPEPRAGTRAGGVSGGSPARPRIEPGPSRRGGGSGGGGYTGGRTYSGGRGSMVGGGGRRGGGGGGRRR